MTPSFIDVVVSKKDILESDISYVNLIDWRALFACRIKHLIFVGIQFISCQHHR